MDDSDKKTIQVSVGGRSYPIRIEPIEEDKIKRAAQLTTEKVAHYQQLHPNMDMQDYLAMAALGFVIKLIEADGRQTNADIIDQLSDLDQWLGAYLEKQNIGSSFK